MADLTAREEGLAESIPSTINTINSDLAQALSNLQSIALDLQRSASADPALGNNAVALQSIAGALQKHTLHLREMIDPLRSVLRPERFYQAGVVAAADKQFERAAGFFRRALELRTEYPEAHKALGDVLSKLATPYYAMQENESGDRARVLPVPDGTIRPLWSVMIPTYNCAQYLRETLASVLAQDPGAEHMQIEVVDNCSTKDDPQAVVREMEIDRVVFHRQPKNVGHIRNFETCLRRSRGYLIHLLHGDDAVRPGFYAKMEAIFGDHPEIGAAFTRNMFIDEHGNWIGVTPLELSHSGVIGDLVERLAICQRIQPPAMVVRREVYETLGAFDRRLSWTGDWEMWARIATRYPVWYEAEPLALYRMHANSLTARYTLTGENVDDLRRLFSILKGYEPNGTGGMLTRQGRHLYARKALEGAAGMAAKGNFSSVVAQARAAVHLSSTPAILWPLFRLACQSLFYGMRRLRSRTL